MTCKTCDHPGDQHIHNGICMRMNCTCQGYYNDSDDTEAKELASEAKE